MKKKLSGFVIAIVMIATLLCPSMAMAFAAGDFAADVEGNAVYPAGCSQKEVTTALNAKVAEMNVKIKAITDAKVKTLEEAYKAGEIVAYSKKNGGIINAENKRSGWKVWEGAAVMDLRFINAGYDGWGENSIAWLSYNGVTKKANIITAEFADKFGNNGNQKLGTPVNDMFRIVTGQTYVAYQNFTSGYMKSTNGAVTVVNKKNVVLNTEKTDVTVVDADPTSTGVIGAASQATLDKAVIAGEVFANTFVKAYNDFKAAGIDLGFPWSPVMADGKNSSGVARYGTITTQNFRWGSSVSDPWNDASRSGWAFLAYNFEEAKVYLIRDEFHSVFEKDDATLSAKQLGDPVGNDFVYEGNRYQNFEKGYLKAAGATAANTNVAAVVSGKNMTSAGEVSLNVTIRIGKLGKTATAPAGYTSETIKAAFVAEYNSKVNLTTLTGVDLVEKRGDMLLQQYTDATGGVHALLFVNNADGGNGTFYYLLPAVLTIYNENSALGKPIAQPFEVANVTDSVVSAYAFENGYIRLTVSQQDDFNDDGDIVKVTNYSAVATVGANFDAEKKFFETVSFADSITEAIVNGSVAEKAFDFLNIPQKAELAKIFQDAYTAAFGKGFSAGEPASEGITWWSTGNSGIVKLTLKGGNGNANFWGDNTLMTYDPVDKKVRIVTGKIANTYANDGASGNGWAKTEMMINTKTGVIVQQYDIHDTVVTERPVYIMTKDGNTQKIAGTYDFEANKEGGEWVEYITRFGGSIAGKSVIVNDSYKTGKKLTVDFASFVDNVANYNVIYTLTSDKGELSDNGEFTLTPNAAGKVTVTVEARSAFDKLTLTAEINVVDDSIVDPVPPAPTPDKGCGSVITTSANGILFAAIAMLLVGCVVVLPIIKNKKSKNNKNN